jgi:hypothetical protein
VVPGLLVGFPIAFLLGGARGYETFAIFAVIAVCIASVVFGYWLAGKLSERTWQPYCLRMSERCYQELWRGDILNFLARSYMSYQMLQGFVSAQSFSSPRAAWIKYYVEQDYALAIFAIAHRFVV